MHGVLHRKCQPGRNTLGCHQQNHLQASAYAQEHQRDMSHQLAQGWLYNLAPRRPVAEVEDHKHQGHSEPTTDSQINPLRQRSSPKGGDRGAQQPRPSLLCPCVQPESEKDSLQPIAAPDHSNLKRIQRWWTATFCQTQHQGCEQEKGVQFSMLSNNSSPWAGAKTSHSQAATLQWHVQDLLQLATPQATQDDIAWATKFCRPTNGQRGCAWLHQIGTCQGD